MSWLDIFAGQVLNFHSLFQQPVPGRFIPKPIQLCQSLCRVGNADHWPVIGHYQALYQLAIFLQAGLHRTQLSDAKLKFSRESQNPSLVFPKVFSVELCHVIAIFQVTSNLLPTHVAHLCFFPVYYQFKCVLIFHHIGGKPLSSVLFQSAIVGRSFTRALGVGRSAGSCGRNRLTRCGTPGKSRRGEEDHDQPPWEEL